MEKALDEIRAIVEIMDTATKCKLFTMPRVMRTFACVLVDEISEQEGKDPLEVAANIADRVSERIDMVKMEGENNEEA